MADDIMHNRDIVARLREVKCSDAFAQVRLDKGIEEIERLRAKVADLETRIGDASMMLADWDGYYDPTAKTGNAEELASLIEDSYKILQGKSWRKEN